VAHTASQQAEFPDEHAAAQKNQLWLQYQPRDNVNRLAPVEFRWIMAIRCHTLPEEEYTSMTVKSNSVCCGNVDISTPGALIAHALNCKMNGFTPASRHNLIKFSVKGVLERVGLQTVLEPTNYSHLYGSGAAQRPDLTVWHPLPVPVTTDFVIVQQTGGVPGKAANVAAKIKIDTHEKVVNKLNHRFVPFVMEAHGFEHSSVASFINHVSVTLPGYLKRELHIDIRTAASVALARARYHAVIHVLANQNRGHNLFDMQRNSEVGDAVCLDAMY